MKKKSNWISRFQRKRALEKRQKEFGYKLRNPLKEYGWASSLRWNGNPFLSDGTFFEGVIFVFPNLNAPRSNSLFSRKVSPEEIQSKIQKVIESRDLSRKVSWETGMLFTGRFIDTLQNAPVVFDSESFSMELGPLEQDELEKIACQLCREIGYSSVLIKDHATNAKFLLVLEQEFSL